MDEAIKKEFETIRERNRRVELDKAWEVSWARRVLVAVITYVIAGIWLLVIGNTRPWLNAFIPTAGYILSTLSIPFVKSLWVNRRARRSK